LEFGTWNLKQKSTALSKQNGAAPIEAGTISSKIILRGV